MNSDNSKIIEAATTAAFMMKGLHAAGYDQCIKSWDRGCIEMVQEMTSYVPMIISVIDVASSMGGSRAVLVWLYRWMAKDTEFSKPRTGIA